MEVKDQQYQINGVSLIGLAKEYGTPLYVYNGEKILEKVKLIQKSFAGVNLKIKYATKALSNINILKLMKKAGTGVDAVSIEEVKLCQHAGFEPHEIMYTPNSVSFEEIQEAVYLGVLIKIEIIPMLYIFVNLYGFLL